METDGLPLKRLSFESYFIAKGYVTLSFAELRKLPANYAEQLFVALKTTDEVAAETHKQQMEAAQSRSRI